MEFFKELFQWILNQHHILRFLTPNCIYEKIIFGGSYYHFLQTLKSNANETAQQSKKIFYKCAFIWQQLTVWENQVVKIIAPY
jgi:hypothetical protein